MKKKLFVACLSLVAVSTLLFPASAGTIYELNKYFYTDATKTDVCGAQGGCENWGYRTKFVQNWLCP